MKQTPANLGYQRLKAMKRRAYRVSDLPKPFVDGLAATRMNPAHDHLDVMLESKGAGTVKPKSKAKSASR